MKHTKGPWELYQVNKTETRVYGKPMSRNVATITGSGADANLISAAPEMLEALQIAMECLDSPEFRHEHPSVEHHIRHAIAKAKGESK